MLKHPIDSQTESRRAWRWSEWVAVLVLTAPFVVMTVAVVLQLLADRLPLDSDFADWHLPVRRFYFDALQNGTAYDWMPDAYNGYNIAGEGQAGTYHPLHRIAYGVLPFNVAFWLETAIHYPFAALGAFLWLRRFFGVGASVVGTAAFALNSYMLLHYVHINLLAVFAHAPWALWAMDLTFDPATRRRGALILALIAASQCLLGHPQMLLFCLTAEAVYFLVRMTQVGSLGGAAAIVLANVLGALMGAAQVFATLGYMQLTGRDHSVSYSMFLSVPPVGLLQLLSPYSLDNEYLGFFSFYGHETGIYSGLVTMMLLILGVGYLFRRSRTSGWRGLDDPEQIAVVGLVCIVLCVIITIGEAGGLYSLVVKLPLFSRGRCPGRFIGLAQICMGFVAALVVDRAARPSSSVGKPALAVAATFPIAALIITRSLNEPLFLWPTLWHALFAVAALLALAFLTRRAALPAVLAALMILDQGIFASRKPAWSDVGTEEEWFSRFPTPPDHNGLVFDCTHGSNRLSYFGYRQLFGYAAMPPQLRLNYFAQRNAWRAAGAQWVYTYPRDKSGETPADAVARWYPEHEPLPRVRFVNRTMPTVNPAKDIGLIDITEGALVFGTLKLDETAGGQAALVVDEPGLLEVDLQCDGRLLLTISDRYEKGWTAEVDGEPRPITVVNGDFLGCVVLPGERRVTFRFEPTELVVGKVVSVLSTALFGCLAIVFVGLPVLQRVREQKSPAG